MHFCCNSYIPIPLAHFTAILNCTAFRYTSTSILNYATPGETCKPYITSRLFLNRCSMYLTSFWYMNICDDWEVKLYMNIYTYIHFFLWFCWREILSDERNSQVLRTRIAVSTTVQVDYTVQRYLRISHLRVTVGSPSWMNRCVLNIRIYRDHRFIYVSVTGTLSHNLNVGSMKTSLLIDLYSFCIFISDSLNNYTLLTFL